ncbi:hypothetical protein [Vibrio hyugaensis]|uniref:hypothetical protein n=1 Tax=Vibrio hyugaensis TaxID=1534743 RepID=UPI0012E036C5|nr:hypothetical protein [Vibrio hyugaensis]
MRRAEPPCLTKVKDQIIVSRDWMGVEVVRVMAIEQRFYPLYPLPIIVFPSFF